MQLHYKDARFDGKDATPVETAIKQVEVGMAAVGRPVDLKSHLTAKEGSDLEKAGYLITPDYSDALENYLDNVPWLTINESITGHFGETTGSTEITAIVVENDLSTMEVIKRLNDASYSNDDSNLLDKFAVGIETLLPTADKNPDDPNIVIAYDLLRKSLGWEAEKLLAKHDDFSKAQASMDSYGIDLKRDSDTWTGYEFDDSLNFDGFQLKTMARVTSQNLHKKDHKHPHLSYAWTNDGLLLADMEERNGKGKGNTDEQAKAISKVRQTNMTEVKKSHDGGVMGNYHRPARVIAKTE